MSTIKIAPKYVNAAGAGKKYGSVVHQDGVKYLVKQEHMGSFHKGVEIEVETRSEPWTNGTLIASPVLGQQAPSPAPSNGNGHKANDAETAERIYVCGIVNNWVQGAASRGHITQEQLVTVTNAARGAYAATFGAK